MKPVRRASLAGLALAARASMLAAITKLISRVSMGSRGKAPAFAPTHARTMFAGITLTAGKGWRVVRAQAGAARVAGRDGKSLQQYSSAQSARVG